MDEATMIAMTAAMEGEATVVKNIGRKVKVSEMEMFILVNFAEIGLLSLFSAMDDDMGESAEQELSNHLDAIRHTFAKPGNKVTGLDRLTQSATAILRAPRFVRFMAHKKEG